MRGESLHRFDLQLSDYVVGNLRQHFDNADFAAWVRTSVPEALAKYLDDGPAEVDSPELLLGDKELFALATALENPPLELDRIWLPYNSLHERYISTLSDIRECLCTQAAEDWGKTCASYGKRLSARRLSLHDGIEIVHEWLWQLRRYLGSIKAFEFLPCPMGTFPTPLSLATLSNGSRSTEDLVGMPLKTIAHIERMRHAIKNHPLGHKASPDALIRTAAIGKQSARNILRWLQERGEYEGFARERPQRFVEGRRNSK